MASVPRRQPSALLSTGLSVTTALLNVAGAVTDTVPIAKQILNSAAHISAVAEKIQRKREAMYTLVEKADIYATQIDIAVAGRVLDVPLKRRLERLYSVFLKIEVLVSDKAGRRSNPLTRFWQNVVTKPNRAETLVVEIEREIQLFQLLTGIHLSLVVDDTARAVAAEARYDGQIRILRDCDIDKRHIIEQYETDQGTVVWASARVDSQLMAIRYLKPSPIVKKDESLVDGSIPRQWDPYNQYLQNIKKVSTISGSHPHTVQLYGLHVRGHAVVFRSGTFPLDAHLDSLRAVEYNEEALAVKFLRLAYKILDASLHLLDVHDLTWVGSAAIVDENGEPRIGLFDDIVQNASKQWPPISLGIFYSILLWFHYRFSEETGVVEQVHNSYLHAIITEQLRNGNDTDRLQQVWDIIREEQLPVTYNLRTFPIISRNLSVSQEMIARAQLFFEALAKDKWAGHWAWFVRCVLAGGVDLSSRIGISAFRFGGDQYRIGVKTCVHDDTHIRYDWFDIIIPTGCPALAQIAQTMGLPHNFEDEWPDRSELSIYQRVVDGRKDSVENTESGIAEV
ncbi:hypothetical protein EXIGLDRAFT_832180 [Exidia glandulosa HHB12029]|uniref:Uncharacterized protein n=1 Tax=Exidia glandulosa HHB12029 TaxID=1314781 RepID=A0A165LVA8_EXIGL|nr:hypothetical protein EXIGLDRAFT_832180 [Exidia glandulosa HHB12029]